MENTEKVLYDITTSESCGHADYSTEPPQEEVLEGTANLLLSLGNIEIHPRMEGVSGRIIPGCMYRVKLNDEYIHATSVEIRLSVRELPEVKITHLPINK